MRSSTVRHLLLVALALLLTGCFNYTEEMWLQQDGSGRLSAEVTLNTEALQSLGVPSPSPAPGSGTASTTAPEGFSEAEMRAKLEGKAGIRLVKVESVQTATGVTVRWELLFDKLADLAALDADNTSAAGGLYTGASWEKGASGKMQFQRQVGSESPAPAGADAISLGLASMMFANSSMTFTTHFPGNVELSSGATLDDGKTARWVIPMSQAMASRQLLTAQVAQPGLPWLWIGIAAFVVVDTLVMALVVMWVVKRREDQKAAAASASGGPGSPKY